MENPFDKIHIFRLYQNFRSPSTTRHYRVDHQLYRTHTIFHQTKKLQSRIYPYYGLVYFYNFSNIIVGTDLQPKKVYIGYILFHNFWFFFHQNTRKNIAKKWDHTRKGKWQSLRIPFPPCVTIFGRQFFIQSANWFSFCLSRRFFSILYKISPLSDIAARSDFFCQIGKMPSWRNFLNLTIFQKILRKSTEKMFN